MEDQSFSVVALDPGVTTGWAYGNWDNGMLTIASGQTKFEHLGIWNALKEWSPKYIVMESFEFRNRHRDGLVLFSCEIIGVVKLYQQISGIDFPACRLFMQNAAQGKGYYSDNKLKEAALYKVNNGHGHDAVRHMLQWYTFGFGYQFNDGKLERTFQSV